MKQLKVDTNKCIGCGACVAIDNEHFEFNDEGKSSVKSQENIDTIEVDNAIDSCPTGAISKSDAENNEEECPQINCEAQPAI